MDLFDPSKTTLRGVISRFPWACRFEDERIKIPVTMAKEITLSILPKSPFKKSCLVLPIVRNIELAQLIEVEGYHVGSLVYTDRIIIKSTNL